MARWRDATFTAWLYGSLLLIAAGAVLVGPHELAGDILGALGFGSFVGGSVIVIAACGRSER